MDHNIPRPWWQSVRRRTPIVLAATAMAVATLPIAPSPAEAAIGTSPIIGPLGFPQWYEDADGQRVELCLDLLSCGTGPETVYWAATAEPPAGLTGQGLDMQVAGAYDAASGQFIVTGRIRIRVSNLVPGEQYTLTHPYGQAVATADLDPNPLDPQDQSGRIKYIEEVGCIIPEAPDGTPPPPAPPCDFTSPLPGPLFQGFLRQQGAPAGFLGDGLLAATPRPVVNGPHGNWFQIEDASGAPVAGPPTTDFLVAGQLAAPVTASMSNTDLGTQKVGSPATRTITVQNSDTQQVTLGQPELSGPNAADFTVAPAPTGGCGSVPIAPGATCRLRLTFQPLGHGSRTATLSFPTDRDAANLVRSLTLTGIGAVPRARISSTLAFGDVGVGQHKTLPLTVRNRGIVGLLVDSVRRAGSREFTADAAACTGAPVRARRSCVIEVTYRPRAVGRDSATLAVAHDAASTPTTVTLSGRGVDATAPAVRTLQVRPSRFDPHGRSASVIVGLNGPGRAAVQVLGRGHVIRNLGVLRFHAARDLHTTWNGRDRHGHVVGAGEYLIQVVARDPAGNKSTRSVRITITR